MVNLPSYPNRLTTIETPQSSLSGAAVAAPYKQLADGLNSIGEGLSSVAENLAENAGAQAVTKDENGNINVERWPIVGKAGVAYARAVKVRALAEYETSANTELTKMREEFRNDPQGFETAAKAFRERKVGEANSAAGPQVGAALGTSIDGSINQNYRGLLNQKQALDLRTAATAIDARTTQLGDDLEVLARRGGVNSPEYKQTLENFDALQKEKVSNPLFAYPQEKADLDREAVITRAQGAAVHDQMEQIYRQRGFEAAKTYLRDSMKELGGSLKAADKIERSGMAWLRAEEAGLRGERDAISREWAAAKGQAGTLAPDVLADIETRARGLGAFRVAEDVAVQRGALSVMSDLRRLPADEQARIARTGIVKGPLVDRIVGAESGGNANATSDTSSATGAGQFIKSTWLDLVKRNRPDLATGKSDEQILALRTDKNLSREMVGTYADENRARLNSAGVRSDDAALYLAHFLGPGDAIKVLSAPPGTPIQNVVNADSIAANKGIFARNPTSDTIQKWAAGKVGVQADGELVDLSKSRTGLTALGMLKKEMGATLVDDIGNLRTRVTRGETLATDDLTALSDKVASLGTPKQQREVAELAAQSEYGAEFARMPAAKRTEVIDAWQQKLKAGGTQFESNLAAQITTANAKIANEYKTDPYGAHYKFGEGTNPLPPVDFGNPQEAAAIINEKVKQQSLIRADQNMPAFSVLRPAEAQAFSQTLATGDAKAVATTFQVLGTLPDDQFAATLDDKTVQSGIIGAMRTTDPTKYNAVMSSLDQVYARAPQTFTDTFGADAWNELKNWQSKLRYYDPKTLADERSKSADPQAAARRKINEQEGIEQARKQDIGKIVGAFDGSYWFTPGPVARALGSQPTAPVDSGTRDALMGDYETIYSRRYAETLDKDVAQRDTVELMRTKWARSEVNGGKLMLNAPETVYPAVNGSYDWMKPQIEGALSERLGLRDKVPSQLPGPVPDFLGGSTAWDYSLVADRQSETDRLAGRPVSYQVVIKDNRVQTPRWDLMKDEAGRAFRFSFDAGPQQAQARTDFAAERQRVLNAPKGVARNMPGFN